MKVIAYTFRLPQSVFKGVEYDHFFTDTDPKRPVLAETIRDFFYSGHGDVILLPSEDHLPVKGVFRKALEAKGVSIRIHDIEGKRGRGRPSGFDPKGKQLGECLVIWNTPYYEKDAAEKISDLVGYKVSRFQCRRTLGERVFSNDD